MTETEQLLKAVVERAAADTAAGARAAAPLPGAASPETLARAEADLGFALPPLLAGLYARVADGGFGPGYGLRPLDEAVAEYRDLRKTSSIPAPAGAAEGPGPGAADWRWPEGVLPIGDWGCAMLACVDCRSEGGPVLLFEPNAGIPDHAWYEDAPSLAAWLHTWLAGSGWYEEEADGLDLRPWEAYRSRL